MTLCLALNMSTSKNSKNSVFLQRSASSSSIIKGQLQQSSLKSCSGINNPTTSNNSK